VILRNFVKGQIGLRALTECDHGIRDFEKGEKLAEHWGFERLQRKI
jgi:hypothetical protein